MFSFLFKIYVKAFADWALPQTAVERLEHSSNSLAALWGKGIWVKEGMVRSQWKGRDEKGQC